MTIFQYLHINLPSLQLSWLEKLNTVIMDPSLNCGIGRFVYVLNTIGIFTAFSYFLSLISSTLLWEDGQMEGENEYQAQEDGMKIVIYQRWSTCGFRATCGSLKDYLWLLKNVPEFPFHLCVIIFLKIIIVPHVFVMCTYVNNFIPL